MSDTAMVHHAPPKVAFFLPAAPLRPFVTAYYTIASDDPVLDYLHPEWAGIRFALAGEWLSTMEGRTTATPKLSSLYGPTDRTSRFEADCGALFGVGLTPTGWGCLIGGNASELANDMRDLGDTLGVDGDKLSLALAADPDDADRVARLDGVMTRQLADHPVPDPRIAIVQDALGDKTVTDVAELVTRTGLSERTLYRICLKFFGFGPKRLLKRQRFLRTLDNFRSMTDEPTRQMLDKQYHDQPHFIRDFHAFMGMTPQAYFQLPREIMRRGAEERLRRLGASMQALHT